MHHSLIILKQAYPSNSSRLSQWFIVGILQSILEWCFDFSFARCLPVFSLTDKNVSGGIVLCGHTAATLPALAARELQAIEHDRR
jgi:hypothetical protein